MASMVASMGEGLCNIPVPWKTHFSHVSLDPFQRTNSSELNYTILIGFQDVYQN